MTMSKWREVDEHPRVQLFHHTLLRRTNRKQSAPPEGGRAREERAIAVHQLEMNPFAAYLSVQNGLARNQVELQLR